MLDERSRTLLKTLIERYIADGQPVGSAADAIAKLVAQLTQPVRWDLCTETMRQREVTAIIEQYRSACAELVAEFDGYIDDHRGDGMLVLFGYPQVDEDDASVSAATITDWFKTVYEPVYNTTP